MFFHPGTRFFITFLMVNLSDVDFYQYLVEVGFIKNGVVLCDECDLVMESAVNSA